MADLPPVDHKASPRTIRIRARDLLRAASALMECHPSYGSGEALKDAARAYLEAHERLERACDRRLVATMLHGATIALRNALTDPKRTIW